MSGCIRALKGRIEGLLRAWSANAAWRRCSFRSSWVFTLGIVTSEDDMDRLPEGYEPLLVSGEPLLTRDVVEDEVLLAVPAFPLHAGWCRRVIPVYENGRCREKDNPFSILEKLKT